MQHVFVETNWLVGCLAPAHHKVPAALELLEKAKRDEVTLYLPSICVSECQRPIREKFQVKLEADRVRKFLLWAKSAARSIPLKKKSFGALSTKWKRWSRMISVASTTH